jgi:signal transduction histidine kinase
MLRAPANLNRKRNCLLAELFTTMRLTRPTVLILSTNPAFAREIAAHWPADSNAPEFTVLEQALFRDLAGANYDLAIADATSPEHFSDLKRALVAAAKPAILIHSELHSDRPLAFVPKRKLPNAENAVVELSRRMVEGEKLLWPMMTGLVGREILRRCQAEARAVDAGTVCAAAQAEATLGRYIAEMRHNINNALTSVLGNAELLTLESRLPANVLSQAETILNMALRLHEVFRRFVSLEEELSVAARQSGQQSKNEIARSAASGK